MAGSLDCSRVAWNSCPIAYHVQFKGKEESPTIIMEVACDYQLQAWLAVVGYAGTFNDINVWENSLLQSLLLMAPLQKMILTFRLVFLSQES